MARTKARIDKDTEKAQMETEQMKKEIICPLTLEATLKEGKPIAANYTCQWERSMVADGADEPGVWYSSPKGRGQEAAFMEELKRRKELPESDPEHITWDEDGFYFSHQEGIEAREKYEQLVLEGKFKANAKSWKNKHAEFTGVSLDELKEKHPELYKSSATTTASTTEQTSSEESTEPEMTGEEETTESEELEPSEAEILAASEEEAPEIEHSGEGLEKDESLTHAVSDDDDEASDEDFEGEESEGEEEEDEPEEEEEGEGDEYESVD